MSLLPPLKAPTTLPPATWPLAVRSFKGSVNSVTWEVSHPMIPIFKSSARPARAPRNSNHRAVEPQPNRDRPTKPLRRDGTQKREVGKIFAGCISWAGGLTNCSRRASAEGKHQPGLSAAGYWRELTLAAAILRNFETKSRRRLCLQRADYLREH